MLVLGSVVVAFPIYYAFVASTHRRDDLGRRAAAAGRPFVTNYARGPVRRRRAHRRVGVGTLLLNTPGRGPRHRIGKIAISIISAYAIVYFRFPLRMVCFWMIFITLMLPVEVRIVPTYKVMVDLGLHRYLCRPDGAAHCVGHRHLPVPAVLLTIPSELIEAARIDGAGPMRFFMDILLPLSTTNIAALFVILFIYGWTQYLWPLLVTKTTR